MTSSDVMPKPQTFLWRGGDMDDVAYVVRTYPYCSQVFVADTMRPGRYQLTYEEAAEPEFKEVEFMIRYARKNPFGNIR